jgi:hypothetical protein
MNSAKNTRDVVDQHNQDLEHLAAPRRWHGARQLVPGSQQWWRIFRQIRFG